MAPLTDLSGGDPRTGSPQQDLALANPAARILGKLADSQTGVVRLWVDWPTIQPFPGSPYQWGRLDANIQAAKRAGLIVLLSMYRNSPWADPTITGGEFDEHNPAWQATLPDRITAATAADIDTSTSGWAGRLREGIKRGRHTYKTPFFRFPHEVSEGSPWREFVTQVLLRYSHGSALNNRAEVGWIDAFQPVNEPNLVHWPQQGRSANADLYGEGPNTSASTAAMMMLAAQEIARGLGRDGANAPLLLAPDSSDIMRTGRLSTALYRDPSLLGGTQGFTELLLAALTIVGFASDSSVGWSSHNYADVEDEHDDAAGGGHNARRVLDILAEHGWVGYGHDSGQTGIPKLFLTEGGARIGARNHRTGAIIDERSQAQLLARAHQRLLGPLGTGVSLFTQFMLYSQRDYDTGLCPPWEQFPVAPDPGNRPAYDVWKHLPRY